MSQPSSSIVSADNADTKYKKALKQISKLIQANRVLRETNERAQQEQKDRISQLSLRCEDYLKEYQIIRKEKQSLTHYLDEIQKERNNKEREVAYLNEILLEQNAELKKLNIHKDEHAVAALIRTYEEKQINMNRNRSQNQQMISKLKNAVQRLQNQLQDQRNVREDYEQRYKQLSLDINRCKEQNSSLIAQIDRLLKEGSQKDAYCVDKEKQLSGLVVQFQKQVNLLKSAQQDSNIYFFFNQNIFYI